MLCWEKKPKLLPLSDGQTFDLGGRIITAYSCPGHTPGEMIFIDSKTRYLFCADACNRNLLLMQSGDHTEEDMSVWKKLQRRWNELCR